MKLEIIKGNEFSLIVEDALESIEQDGFLAESYLKAFDSAYQYVTYSHVMRRKLSKPESDFARNGMLYRSSQNIIAFSGSRGSGKSSTMLSFSDTLAQPDRLKELCRLSGSEKTFEGFESMHFIVLDPIDPTTLEKNQSILSVVLSRLLYMAEENWKRRLDFYGHFQDKESTKTELLVLARKCLNGISTIKSKKTIAEDLSELQKVGDSSILKKDLYDFVECFIRFYNIGKNIAPENCFLVLQIDDTDCQIAQGFEVMEDIRKYLTVPNVLILMATDTGLLRQVLTQHYVSDFRDNLQLQMTEKEELRNLGVKHLTKLLPPPHVIYLPNIDEVIRDKRDRDEWIHIYYMTLSDNGEKKINLLNPCETSDYEAYDFQSVLLRYIYRKTNLVFVSHDAYANNIIPTTLRGLAHLLSLLSSMEDVPAVRLDKPHEQPDTDFLLEGLKAQLPVLEKNLNRFEEYFLHEWIQAKLPLEMASIIERLANQAPDQRLPFIIEQLESFYAMELYKREVFSGGAIFNNLPEDASYAKLDEMLRIIQGTRQPPQSTTFRQSEDFYFVFAIRTLLTIKNNKDILKVRMKTVRDFDPISGEKIVFDYLMGKTSLPTGFYLDPVQLYGHKLVEEDLANVPYADSALFQKIPSMDSYRFNFTGVIINWLSLQEDDYAKFSQREIWQAQELAAIIAANCDVQEAARKAVAREARKGTTPKDDLIGAVEESLALVQNAVADINQGMFERYRIEEDADSYLIISDSAKNVLESVEKIHKETVANINDIPKFFYDFEAKLPEARDKELKNEQAAYKDRVNSFLKKCNIDLSVRNERVLDQIIAFEPEYKDGELQNKAALKDYVDELYEQLVALVQEKRNESRKSDRN